MRVVDFFWLSREGGLSPTPTSPKLSSVGAETSATDLRGTRERKGRKPPRRTSRLNGLARSLAHERDGGVLIHGPSDTFAGRRINAPCADHLFSFTRKRFKINIHPEASSLVVKGIRVSSRACRYLRALLLSCVVLLPLAIVSQNYNRNLLWP